METQKHLDNTDLYKCPRCNEKELVFSKYPETGVYCQVCGEWVNPKPDRDKYDWYFDSIE